LVFARWGAIESTMKRLFIFGLGYTASRIAAALTRQGWEVISTGRDGTLAFDDSGAVRLALADAGHVLSSVPPGADGDPVLDTYGDALGGKWLGYLSSTGVYGDTRGAWVGRSALDRVREGRAHRIDLPDQVFSRVHVDDIVAGTLAALVGAAGAYNLADDEPCSQNTVIEHACRLLGIPPPPLQTMDEAALSPMARAFYAENRRVANGKARRELGWAPRFPTYREGLANCLLSDRLLAPR